MIFHTSQPQSPLNQFIDSFTYYSGYNPEHSIEKLLPDASINLVIELDAIPRYTFDNATLTPQTKCINAWISGMQTSFICYSAEKHSRMIVIRFKANGSYPFLQLPLLELTDTIIDAEFIFGKEILELRERLLYQRTPDTMFALVGQWLLQHLHQATLAETVVDYSIATLNSFPSLTTINKLTEKTGYSQKHFIQIFKKFVGLTPKKYQRVVRFNKALQEIEKFKNIDWMSISYDCGFYDQAHFINEFKIFADMNPSDYLQNRGKYPNYIPIFSER
ncbi:MAG: AraC family transcriptional regulator [Calditrichaeota bacterium]|nr:MAG: AraC family transcriptional regulator [Calditrichota bacterium]